MSVPSDAFFQRELRCPHCEGVFSTTRVKSSVPVTLKRDADFCTYFKHPETNPILYTVQVCPTCGFSYTDQFRTEFTRREKKLIEEQIVAKWTPKMLGGRRSPVEAMVTYKLAIFSASLTNQCHSVVAGLLLRLAWLYRYEGNQEEERRFLELALNEYEQSYIHSDYEVGDKEMSEVKVLYLIGELARRLGELDKAVRYFSRVAELKNKTMEQGIIRLARDQWQLALQEHREKTNRG
jgi:uncharacterized protein (DUF2225 family)